MIIVGSSFEVLNLLFPSLVPVIQDNPVMALHRSQVVVYWWTLLSNLVTAAIAVMLLRGGIGVLRQNIGSSRTSIAAIKAFLAVVLGAALVSAVYLLPQQMHMLSSSSRTFALIMIISIASALLGLTATLAALWAGHAFILRKTAGDSALR